MNGDDDWTEWVYGKARYSQIRRYSQIQNILANVFKHPGERGFLYLLRRGEKPLSPHKPLSPQCLNLSRWSV